MNTSYRRLPAGSGIGRLEAGGTRNSLGFAKPPRDTRVVAGVRIWF